MKFETDDPEIWRMACEMCANETCFWSDHGDGLMLLVCVNDVFVPAADAEAVSPHEVSHLYERWSIGTSAVYAWVGDRRGEKLFAWKEST